MHFRLDVKPSAIKNSIFGKVSAMPEGKNLRISSKPSGKRQRAMIKYCTMISVGPSGGKGALTMDELFQRMQARAYRNAFAVYNHLDLETAEEDRARVAEELRRLHAAGAYPATLRD